MSLSPDELAKAVRAAGSLRKAEKQLGIPISTIRARLKGVKPLGDEPDSAESFSHDDRGDVAIITAKSRTIRTLDDALAAAKVDLAVWEVERHVVNKWDCMARTRSEATAFNPRTGEPTAWARELTATELWQVKVWLKRKVSRTTESVIGALIARMAKHAPRYPKTARPKPSADPVMVEVSINDAHFGKLAWSRETGKDFDLKIAERVYDNAVVELIRHVAPRSVERWLLPVGNDFFHIDNATGTTTAGTPQDVDGRLTKIFTTGEMAVIRAIDTMLGVAPVKVVLVPGNHDRVTSWHLVHYLRGWYHNNPDVEIDDAPIPRKYVEYGANLIGYTHGDEEKHSRLPNLMATESPDAWARTKFREWRLGHFHIRRETEYVSVDTHEGTVIRILPSLSGTDAWHFRKGYVGVRAADAFMWSKVRGCIGSWSSNVME